MAALSFASAPNFAIPDLPDSSFLEASTSKALIFVTGANDDNEPGEWEEESSDMLLATSLVAGVLLGVDENALKNGLFVPDSWAALANELEDAEDPNLGPNDEGVCDKEDRLEVIPKVHCSNALAIISQRIIRSTMTDFWSTWFCGGWSRFTL